MKRIILAGVASSALFAAHARADAPPPPAPGPCKQDIQALCPDVKPGEGRIAACFKTHFKELSPGCKQAMKNRREHSQASGRPDGPPPASAPPDSGSKR